MTVEKIDPKTIPATFEYIGVVQSSHEVEIRARVTGYLDTIGYLEGSFVHKEDLLFQLDPRPFQAALLKLKPNWQENRLSYGRRNGLSNGLPLFMSRKQPASAIWIMRSPRKCQQMRKFWKPKRKWQMLRSILSYTTIRSPVDGLTSEAQLPGGFFDFSFTRSIDDCFCDRSYMGEFQHFRARYSP